MNADDTGTSRPGLESGYRRKPRRKLILGGFAAAVLVGAAGAASQTFSIAGLDEMASRTCRSIITVLNAAKTQVDVTSAMRIGEANAVSIAYVARPDSGLPRNRRIVCSFEDKGSGFRRSRQLTAVTSDGVPLGPARIRFLQRYWIGSAEAEAAATLNSPRQKK